MSSEDKEDLTESVMQLIWLIKGNPMNSGDHGLSGDVRELKSEIANMKKRDKFVWGVILGMSLFAGAGVGQLLDFLKTFLHK